MRVFFPATLSLVLSLALVGCNGGKNGPVEGVPDVIEEQATGADATAAGTGEGTDSVPVVLTPELIEERVNAAAASLTTGQESDATQALSVLQELSVEAPDLAEIPYNMGVAHEILGNNTEARKRYLRATDIDPGLGEAWLNLGALAEREGDLNRALQAIKLPGCVVVGQGAGAQVPNRHHGHTRQNGKCGKKTNQPREDQCHGSAFG